MMKVRADALRIGDTIMPPEREVRLWMRRHLAERNLPEAALHLTITGIDEGTPDKRGRWLFVTGEPTAAWCADYVDTDPRKHPMRFKARPETPWPKIQ